MIRHMDDNGVFAPAVCVNCPYDCKNFIAIIHDDYLTCDLLNRLLIKEKISASVHEVKEEEENDLFE